MSWTLTEKINTTAGLVAAGSSGAGKALVLAHGWPWSSYSWHRLIPELSKTYHVHWYDMPGYGESEMDENQRTDLGVQGAVFSEMLAHWNLSAPIVIAHDVGGATTLRAHLLGDIEFSQYILMNVVAMRPWGSDYFDHVGKHVDAFTPLPAHIHKAIVESYIQGALVNDLAPQDFNKLTEPWLTEKEKLAFTASSNKPMKNTQRKWNIFFQLSDVPSRYYGGKMIPGFRL